MKRSCCGRNGKLSWRLRIEAGEAVFFDPFNPIPSLMKALRFQSLSKRFTGRIRKRNRLPRLGAKSDLLLLVFSIPPTPNGDLHCGHLSGPYIAGDVLVPRRELWRRGMACVGAHDHQTYVEKKALQERKSPQEVADDFAAALQKTWQAYEIELDGFIAHDRGGAYASFVQ